MWQAIKDFFEYDEIPWEARIFNYNTGMWIAKGLKIVIPFMIGVFVGYLL